MDLLQSLLLGLVQGLTEFLPVSSTAHLILTPYIFGWTLTLEFAQALFAFDILLQWGTLLAVIVYFWRDLWAIARAVVTGLLAGRLFASAEARLGWLIVVATLPAVAAALVFKDLIEQVHGQPYVVIGVLIVFSALIYAAERIGRRNRTLETLTWRDALLIGAAQAVALLPGVSRSGATITGGLAIGLERPAAARFSFLASIPALTGAGVLALRDLADLPNLSSVVPPLLLGTLAAAVVGFACIHWLLGYLAKKSMDVFVWYRLIAGAVFLAVLVWRA
ncbi:MAG: undecaprenyl-diphosphatase UppP [Anaerolineales bacterium]|nr:undecaprenyl-diphosphatase UppP [Anaerolineales bacterium]